MRRRSNQGSLGTSSERSPVAQPHASKGSDASGISASDDPNGDSINSGSKAEGVKVHLQSWMASKGRRDLDVTIIIVSFQSRHDLAECLCRIHENGLIGRVIVADNDSRDGTPDLVRRSFPGATLLSMPRNVGFARACNRAVAMSKSKYCLFLNPDSRISAGTVDELVRFAEEHPRVGIIGPQVLDQDGRTRQLSCRRFPTIGSLFFHRFSILNLLFPENRWRKDYLLVSQSSSEATRVDWVSGCCMLARREMLEALGGFDEQFFLFSEDVDLCLRARQGQWDTFYCPQTSVTHRIGGSSRSLRPIVERHKSVWLYYQKHMTSGRILLDSFVFFAIVVRCITLGLAKVLANVYEGSIHMMNSVIGRAGIGGSAVAKRRAAAGKTETGKL